MIDQFKAVYGITDVRQALIERAQTTLRTVAGSRTLQSLLSDREAVAAEIEGVVEDIAARWGVSIEAILIKDIVFSQELQSSLSAAATQRRIGEAKVILARAEVDSAVLMRQAADILTSPLLFNFVNYKYLNADLISTKNDDLLLLQFLHFLYCCC